MDRARAARNVGLDTLLVGNVLQLQIVEENRYDYSH
jgi:hypothetical protein